MPSKKEISNNKLKEHYIGHRKRLRERFEKNGLESFLEDYEAIELLLTFAIPRKDVKIQAKKLLEKFGSFRGVLEAPTDELRSIPGIGEVAAIAIRFVREAASRYLEQKISTGLPLGQKEALFDYCRAAVGWEPNEVFRVIYLDKRFRLIETEILAEGTIDRAPVYPRKVMESALRKKASWLVFVHNHPDGDVTPSEHDKTITRALVLAGKTLQLEIYDHIIVSKNAIFSFRERGLI
jgi:DNA repair protein RadC